MTTSANRSASIRQVLWIVLWLNLAVTLIKLIVGLFSGALAVVADAFHSLVDSSSNIIGLFGVWIGGRPADDNHPYGHHKYETIATLSIGGMLLVAAFEIGKGVVERFFGSSPPPQVTPVTLGLMAFTFLINLAITFYETRAGKRLQSDILLADAAHTRTDLLVTLSVLISLIVAEFGWTWLDPLVAGGVVVLLVRAGLEILRSASYVLTDAAIANPDEVRRIALSVTGVRSVDTIRSRGRVDAGYADLHVRVDAAMDAEQAHNIATEVKRRIMGEMHGVLDAIVHIEPERRQNQPATWTNIAYRVRRIADGLGLSLHDLHAHVEHDGGYAVEMHVEVDASLTLGAAHALVDQLEARLSEAVPEMRSLVTHIEPLAAELPDEAGEIIRTAELRERITHIADGLAGTGACHAVKLHNINGHLTATLHIAQPADKPLTEAHALAEAIERKLHGHLHRLNRVVVHVEPPE